MKHTNNRLTAKHLLFLFGLLLSVLHVFANGNENEEGRGGIRGIVYTTDKLPAAMVTVTIKGTKKNTITGDDGSFMIRNVQPGNYELEVSLVGYETITEEVSVAANKTATVILQLKISDKQLQEVIVRSGIKSYKSNIPSSTLRIQTPLLEMSQNIQIVTNKTLADQQIISMSDGLIRNVSGAVRLEHWADLYANITARGSQIQAFRNGFNVVNSYWGPLTEDMSFVDHVEFVKGPAGFMLANGDPSGLYNVVSKKPTGQTKGEAAITIGSYDLYRATLDLDGKLSEDGKLLYRLNLMGQNKNSFRANEYNNRYSIAPVIAFQVDDKTKLTLEYTLQHARMSDVGSYYVFSSKGYATLPQDFTAMPPGMEPTIIDDHSVTLNLQHQISNNWKLTAQAAYFNYQQVGSDMWPAAVNEDGTMQRAVSSWDAKSKMTLAQAFVNGDLTTGTIRHRILAGIDVGTKDYIPDWGQYHVFDSVGAEFSTLAPSYGIPSNGYPSFDHDKSTLQQRAQAVGGLMDQRYTGVYVQDELGFFDNLLRLTLAGRYSEVKQSQWGGEAQHAKHFSPRVGLSVSLDKFTSVYALYDQAFIPQAGRLANGGSIKPITGNNMEVDIKKDWANGKWNSTLSVYRIIKNNELTADPNSPPTSGLSIVLGQKRSQGIEFDLRGKITSNISLIANYALTDSKVTKVADGIANMKVGDIVPGYSRHTINSWLNYKIQNGALKGTGIAAGFTWLIDRETDTWSVGLEKLPDYFKLDGGLFWENNKIKLTVNVFNILDKYLYSGSYYSYLNAYYWQAESPGNVRFSVAYNF
ncbi:MAG: TonB-dependent siderophore receptor [Panacibacter sp.]